MAKRNSNSPAALQFAFFKHLWSFYRGHRARLRANYKPLIRRFLDYNDPVINPAAFLRVPQFEALEIYVFIKERLENKPVHDIFDAWYHQKPPFQDRDAIGLEVDDQGALFDQFDEQAYMQVFNRLRAASSGAPYSNYIFALTMGTGKTILMATTIFLDFLLANAYPKDKRYARNALVFAPDKTVLESLREIQTFDRTLIVPPDYARVLDALITFHFLEDTGTTLTVLDGSSFNVVISNTQKIILKRQNKEASPTEQLLKSGKPGYQRNGAFAEAADLYKFDDLDETELSTNQRFEKLRRLGHLAIYVDEAHHAFGNKLESDLNRTTRAKTSLRLTIDELALEHQRAGRAVVACYNFTGTPYAGGSIFPEVVYAYGLRDAIDSAYLKKVRVVGYENSKSAQFIRDVVRDFCGKHAEAARFEGLRPKLAIFATSIKELQEELRPVVEDMVAELGLPSSTVLVNVGDAKLTSNDDLREFKRLDTPASDKQIILLVNKGKEGWNCRSLFGVALYRKPKSKIFVLQASMRCLRAIDHPPQRTGHIYLSQENLQILDDELNQNFRVGLQQIREAGVDRDTVEVRPVPPPRTVKIKRIKKLWQVTPRVPGPGVQFDFGQADIERYQATKSEQEGLTFDGATRARRTLTDLTAENVRRVFSPLTVTAEIARYLNLSPFEIEDVLRASHEGMDEVVSQVNTYNELLYDWVIPKLFHAFFEVEPFTKEREDEVLLVREPEGGVYRIQADPDKVVRNIDAGVLAHLAKSFHLDAYCFDSKPEQRLFLELLEEGRVKQIFFTGMLTHGQSDFFIEYIDPESHNVRTYYPDFLIETVDGEWLIVEVKRDDQIDAPVVQAKAEATRLIATASRMVYRIIAGGAVMDGKSTQVLSGPSIIRA